MRFASVLVAVLWATTSSAQTPPAASSASQPNPGIVAVANAYVKAVMAKDAKAVAALYTDDAMEMPPNEPSIKGRAAIEQYYEKEFAGPGPSLKSLELTHLDTVAAGMMGHDVGTFRQTVSGDTGPMTMTGKYVVLLKKVGNDWKVTHAIYNDDQPRPAMAPSASTPPPR